jgi:hypothetical protein
MLCIDQKYYVYQKHQNDADSYYPNVIDGGFQNYSAQWFSWINLYDNIENYLVSYFKGGNDA